MEKGVQTEDENKIHSESGNNIKIRYCKRRPGKQIICFCEECKELFCKKCFIKHVGHEAETLDKFCENRKKKYP